MTIKNIPWAVTGNEQTLHTSALVRNANFALSGGKTGVINNGFKPRANSSPNNTIIISKGTGIIRNTKILDEEQSYIVSSSGDTVLTLNTTANTTSRTDFIVLTIQDPEYDTSVTMNSSREFTKFKVLAQPEVGILLTQGVPFIPICKIDWPARTSQITSRMITDIRDFADNSNAQTYTPTLQNGWRPYNNSSVTYYKTSDGYVHFTGLVYNNTRNWTRVFNLPEECRPRAGLNMPALLSPSSGGEKKMGYVAIKTNGDVEIEVGTVAYVSLDNISFLAKTGE